MTPEASLQNRGKREPGVRRGPRPGCAGRGRSPGNAFLPAPGPPQGLRGARGPGPTAHAGPAARAWHLRGKAARGPNPPRRSGPVLHRAFPLPRLEATALAVSRRPAPPRPLTLQPPGDHTNEAATAHFLPAGPMRTLVTPESRPLFSHSPLKRQACDF